MSLLTLETTESRTNSLKYTQTSTKLIVETTK